MKEVIEKCYCDRCKKEMPERHTVGFKVGHRTMAIQTLTDEWHYIDLCDECVHRFERWFRPKKYDGKVVEENWGYDLEMAESEET